MPMRKKHQSTLAAVFEDPIRANLHWHDIETLLIALGADCSEGKGSRLRVSLGGVKAVFHRPHPEKEASKGMVCSLRRFLIEAGIKP